MDSKHAPWPSWIKLATEQAQFAPKLEVRRLTAKDFEARGMMPSPDLRMHMRQHDFYDVGIPVTLFPRSGWAFTRLECAMEFFCPDEVDLQARPTVYEIFPDDVWAELFKGQVQWAVGLDENLRFRAQAQVPTVRWQHLSAMARAKVAAEGKGQAQFVVGPFTYQLRRSTVRSRRGVGTSPASGVSMGRSTWTPRTSAWK